MFGIRSTLKLGSIVFGLSALLLVVAPEFFLELLQLDSDSLPLVWAMRMIGVTLVALAGNMWVNSTNVSDSAVVRVGFVMAVSATGLGVLTLLIPAALGWFTYLYAAVGFGFGANYVVCLLRRKY
jgi:hypothetical protein